MRRTRIVWKLYAGIVLLTLLTAAIVGMLAHLTIARESRVEVEVTLAQHACLLRDLARPAFADAGDPGLQARLRQLGLETGIRLTVIDADGVVLADSDEDPARMENHANRPEVRDALDSGRGTVSRYSRTLEQEMMYLALPVSADGDPVGCVRTSLPLSAVDARLALIRGTVSLGMLLALLVALPLGWWLARRITSPLTAMTRAAEAMAQGDYQQRVLLQTHDELRTLAETLNEMSARLSERMEAITRERSQLAAILGSMVEGLVAVDADERIVHINAVAAQLAGVPAEQCIGLRVWEVLRIPALTEVLRAALRQADAVEGDIVLARTPHDLVLTAFAAPWLDGSGAVVGAVAVLHNRTRIRQLERTRQDFVANASHELKSPVTAIRGLAETIQDDPAMDVDTRSTFISRILDETGRLAGIVGDMLALARAERQDEAEEHVPLDLREVAAAALATFEAKAATNEIELSGKTSESPVPVSGSAEALREAVGNLIDNALNYTPAGGSVTVSVGVQDDRALVAVSDTGIGIAAEHQERIFERFYRADKARSRQLGGTGLGLAIVKHIVQAHQGEIAVASRPGRGSTFTISLPLAPRQA